MDRLDTTYAANVGSAKQKQHGNYKLIVGGVQ
jgi:hypothetical protein